MAFSPEEFRRLMDEAAAGANALLGPLTPEESPTPTPEQPTPSPGVSPGVSQELAELDREIARRRRLIEGAERAVGTQAQDLRPSLIESAALSVSPQLESFLSRVGGAVDEKVNRGIEAVSDPFGPTGEALASRLEGTPLEAVYDVAIRQPAFGRIVSGASPDEVDAARSELAERLSGGEVGLNLDNVLIERSRGGRRLQAGGDDAPGPILAGLGALGNMMALGLQPLAENIEQSGPATGALDTVGGAFKGLAKGLATALTVEGPTAIMAAQETLAKLGPQGLEDWLRTQRLALRDKRAKSVSVGGFATPEEGPGLVIAKDAFPDMPGAQLAAGITLELLADPSIAFGAVLAARAGLVSRVVERVAPRLGDSARAVRAATARLGNTAEARVFRAARKTTGRKLDPQVRERTRKDIRDILASGDQELAVGLDLVPQREMERLARLRPTPVFDNPEKLRTLRSKLADSDVGKPLAEMIDEAERLKKLALEARGAPDADPIRPIQLAARSADLQMQFESLVRAASVSENADEIVEALVRAGSKADEAQETVEAVIEGGQKAAESAAKRAAANAKAAGDRPPPTISKPQQLELFKRRLVIEAAVDVPDVARAPDVPRATQPVTQPAAQPADAVTATLSTEEAARRLGIGRHAVRKRIKNGTLRAEKDGLGEWRILESDMPGGQVGDARVTGSLSGEEFVLMNQRFSELFSRIREGDADALKASNLLLDELTRRGGTDVKAHAADLKKMQDEMFQQSKEGATATEVGGTMTPDAPGASKAVPVATTREFMLPDEAAVRLGLSRDEIVTAANDGRIERTVQKGQLIYDPTTYKPPVKADSRAPAPRDGRIVQAVKEQALNEVARAKESPKPNPVHVHQEDMGNILASRETLVASGRMSPQTAARVDGALTRAGEKAAEAARPIDNKTVPIQIRAAEEEIRRIRQQVRSLEAQSAQARTPENVPSPVEVERLKGLRESLKAQLASGVTDIFDPVLVQQEIDRIERVLSVDWDARNASRGAAIAPQSKTPTQLNAEIHSTKLRLKDAEQNLRMLRREERGHPLSPSGPTGDEIAELGRQSKEASDRADAINRRLNRKAMRSPENRAQRAQLEADLSTTLANKARADKAASLKMERAGVMAREKVAELRGPQAEALGRRIREKLTRARNSWAVTRRSLNRSDRDELRDMFDELGRHDAQRFLHRTGTYPERDADLLRVTEELKANREFEPAVELVAQLKKRRSLLERMAPSSRSYSHSMELLYRSELAQRLTAGEIANATIELGMNRTTVQTLGRIENALPAQLTDTFYREHVVPVLKGEFGKAGERAIRKRVRSFAKDNGLSDEVAKALGSDMQKLRQLSKPQLQSLSLISDPDLMARIRSAVGRLEDFTGRVNALEAKDAVRLAALRAKGADVSELVEVTGSFDDVAKLGFDRPTLDPELAELPIELTGDVEQALGAVTGRLGGAELQERAAVVAAGGRRSKLSQAQRRLASGLGVTPQEQARRTLEKLVSDNLEEGAARRLEASEETLARQFAESASEGLERQIEKDILALNEEAGSVSTNAVAVAGISAVTAGAFAALPHDQRMELLKYGGAAASVAALGYLLARRGNIARRVKGATSSSPRPGLDRFTADTASGRPQGKIGNIVGHGVKKMEDASLLSAETDSLRWNATKAMLIESGIPHDGPLTWMAAKAPTWREQLGLPSNTQKTLADTIAQAPPPSAAGVVTPEQIDVSQQFLNGGARTNTELRAGWSTLFGDFDAAILRKTEDGHRVGRFMQEAERASNAWHRELMDGTISSGGAASETFRGVGVEGFRQKAMRLTPKQRAWVGRMYTQKGEVPAEIRTAWDDPEALAAVDGNIAAVKQDVDAIMDWVGQRMIDLNLMEAGDAADLRRAWTNLVDRREMQRLAETKLADLEDALPRTDPESRPALQAQIQDQKGRLRMIEEMDPHAPLESLYKRYGTPKPASSVSPATIIESQLEFQSDIMDIISSYIHNAARLETNLRVQPVLDRYVDALRKSRAGGKPIRVRRRGAITGRLETPEGSVAADKLGDAYIEGIQAFRDKYLGKEQPTRGITGTFAGIPEAIYDWAAKGVFNGMERGIAATLGKTADEARNLVRGKGIKVIPEFVPKVGGVRIAPGKHFGTMDNAITSLKTMAVMAMMGPNPGFFMLNLTQSPMNTIPLIGLRHYIRGGSEAVSHALKRREFNRLAHGRIHLNNEMARLRALQSVSPDLKSPAEIRRAQKRITKLRRELGNDAQLDAKIRAAAQETAELDEVALRVGALDENIKADIDGLGIQVKNPNANQDMMSWMMWAASSSESINRKVAGFGTYRKYLDAADWIVENRGRMPLDDMERQFIKRFSGGLEGYSDGHTEFRRVLRAVDTGTIKDDALEAAFEATQTSQLSYTRGSGSLLSQRSHLASLGLLFKTFVFKTWGSFYGKLNPRQRAVWLLMHAAIGGPAALPFFSFVRSLVPSWGPDIDAMAEMNTAEWAETILELFGQTGFDADGSVLRHVPAGIAQVIPGAGRWHQQIGAGNIPFLEAPRRAVGQRDPDRPDPGALGLAMRYWSVPTAQIADIVDRGVLPLIASINRNAGNMESQPSRVLGDILQQYSAELAYNRAWEPVMNLGVPGGKNLNKAIRFMVQGRELRTIGGQKILTEPATNLQIATSAFFGQDLREHLSATVKERQVKQTLSTSDKRRQVIEMAALKPLIDAGVNAVPLSDLIEIQKQQKAQTGRARTISSIQASFSRLTTPTLLSLTEGRREAALAMLDRAEQLMTSENEAEQRMGVAAMRAYHTTVLDDLNQQAQEDDNAVPEFRRALEQAQQFDQTHGTNTASRIPASDRDVVERSQALFARALQRAEGDLDKALSISLQEIGRTEKDLRKRKRLEAAMERWRLAYSNTEHGVPRGTFLSGRRRELPTQP